MSNKLYTSIPAPKVPRNTFDRSRPNSLTMPFQRCVPTMLEEILPGDLFRVGQETFARLQPLIAPVMNNMKISNHAFFVPLRTLNKHFAEFMFNNKSGDYSEVLPYIYTDTIYSWVDEAHTDKAISDAVLVEVIRLLDYIGLPFVMDSSTLSASQIVANWIDNDWNYLLAQNPKRVNIAPFLAYTKVWSEYFRDENLVEDPFEVYESSYSIDVFDLTGDVSDVIDFHFLEYFCQLRPRAWAHDRFTSSLPFAQRGPDVLLPIAGTADVKYKDGFLLGDVTPLNTQKAVLVGGNPRVESKFDLGTGGSTVASLVASTASPNSRNQAAIDPNGSLEVDFNDAALTTTINTFRRAERLQRWYENSARGGVRPNEATLAHFGVRTPDATLDRAEFLGGHMQPIVISEVAQTSETTQASPQGTLAGKATSYKGAGLFRHFFSEHGFVFVFTSALVRANYWQGIPKVFSRMQRDEYYWPEFANLGEEPVYTKEIYAAATEEDTVFGYVPRYSDYKSAIGEVHSDMRSTMEQWTQTREFANMPGLNAQFIYGNPSNSPFAVQAPYNNPIIVTIQYTVKASRLMPFYGVPTI